MNQRNVEALELILVAQLGKSRTFREQAEFLASQGVLVPSALTDDELADAIILSGDGEGVVFPAVLQECLNNLAKGDALPERGYATREEKRAELERIAKGEF